MKTSRATVDANREKVLEKASEGFRRHGFDGIRVADIMQAAGLTHGAFRTYFASKDDLVAQTLAASLKRQGSALANGAGLDSYVENYLTTVKRDTPEQACLLPSLAAEVARQGEYVRVAFSAGLDDYIKALSQRATSRAEAIVTLSTLVGAMTLARAAQDEDLSQEILAAAHEALLES